MDTNKPFSSDLIKLITKWVENKLYGSIEIYFEKGQVTQFTQRIIKKINHERENNQLSSDNNNLQARKLDSINISLGNGHEDNLNQVVD